VGLLAAKPRRSPQQRKSGSHHFPRRPSCQLREEQKQKKVESKNQSKIPILSTCEAMSHFLLQELHLSSILVLVISDDANYSDALALAFR
jgi:hypothetical protein